MELAKALGRSLIFILTLNAQTDPALDMVEGIKRWLREQKPVLQPDPQRFAFDLGVTDPRLPPHLERLQGELVRWDVLPHIQAEGLLLEPSGSPRCHAVAIPDTGQQPEQLAAARTLQQKGCRVLVPALIGLRQNLSANPAINKRYPQSHREFLYRMSFPLGRHIIGYDIQTIRAAIDWLAPQGPVELHGNGEGALLAHYTHFLDTRVTRSTLTGYRGLNDTRLDHNIWRVRLDGPPEPAGTKPLEPSLNIEVPHAARREARLFQQIVNHTQYLIVRAERERATLKPNLAETLWNDVFGRLPRSSAPPATQNGPLVTLPLNAHVFAHGLYLKPANLQPGEKRPLIVLQHGLNGRPQHLTNQSPGTRERDVYRNFADTLTNEGYLVYAPQNPYIHDFRPIARLGNPQGFSLYSFILAQYERMFEWFAQQPEIDTANIAFYGLSYGGKTALRVPPLLKKFKAVVCAGDFNEWIRKLVTLDEPYSYMFTHEYEIVEWNLAFTASHAEMAQLLAPTPFMVERGHRDGVGSDEWVAYEYAKVRRYYDENGWGDRARIAFFNGPHRVDGVEALEFLKRWVPPPAAAAQSPRR